VNLVSEMAMKLVLLLHTLWLGRCDALTVAVAGATGRVGQLVVRELLAREEVDGVRALVRDADKAAKVFGESNERLSWHVTELTDAEAVERGVGASSAIVWAATGFSDSPALSVPQKLKAFVTAVLAKPSTSFDARALATIGDVATSKNARVVCCSSAAVTRPTWSDAKKQRYPGAADIPIVRLNPLDVLSTKREGENALRKRASRYCIVRPTGLNDEWPAGRVVLSQGDLAVGRINRHTVASFLVDVALMSSDVTDAKTFECFSLVGYPAPESLETQCARLRTDSSDSFSEETLDATYALLQQLVPGETLQPNQLAMGQTYEQLDRNETGRLGERGTEQPVFAATA